VLLSNICCFFFFFLYEQEQEDISYINKTLNFFDSDSYVPRFYTSAGAQKKPMEPYSINAARNRMPIYEPPKIGPYTSSVTLIDNPR
jgi:hypothetical protein